MVKAVFSDNAISIMDRIIESDAVFFCMVELVIYGIRMVEESA